MKKRTTFCSFSYYFFKSTKFFLYKYKLPTSDDISIKAIKNIDISPVCGDLLALLLPLFVVFPELDPFFNTCIV